MTWHVIRVRSKDAQKQLARTSLSKDSNTNFYCEHFGNSTIFGFSVTLERLYVPFAAISKVPESLAEWKEPKSVHVTGHVVLEGKKVSARARSCANHTYFSAKFTT